MPIQVTCTGCQRTLKVPETAAGKRIKCPKCQAIVKVPSGAASAVASAPAPAAPAPAAAPTAAKAAPAAEQWHVQTDEGEQFGPVSRTELDEWAAEGRLNSDCQILREGGDQWQWATDLYPQLEAAGAAAEPQPTAAAPAGEFSFATADAGQTSSPASRGRSKGKAKGRKAVAASGDGEASARSKMTAGLLGLFLGGWGVHRFYLGYTQMGIIQIIVTLCTCVGAWWGIIEGVMILTGSFDRDADGKLLQ